METLGLDIVHCQIPQRASPVVCHRDPLTVAVLSMPKRLYLA